jgi:ACS family glucarate transporter-like MFS transporter
MWAIPMGIAPEHCGTASGMMKTGSALAAIISPVASGFLIDRYRCDNGRFERAPLISSNLCMALSRQ